MIQKNHVYLDGNQWLSRSVWPESEKWIFDAGIKAMLRAKLNFFKVNNLLKCNTTLDFDNLENNILYVNDFNEIGIKFINSLTIDKWMNSCDRKRIRLAGKGMSEIGTLVVYNDTKILSDGLKAILVEKPQ